MPELKERYLKQLQLLTAALGTEEPTPLAIHGTIHLFEVQFDLALALLSQLLDHHDSGAFFSSGPREIIMEAYDEYAFMGDSLWLEMMRERDDRSNEDTRWPALIERIRTAYMPAFRALANAVIYEPTFI